MHTPKETVLELLSKMGFEADVDAEESDEEILVDIDTEDSGLLIGYHGETLHSMQLILGMLLNRERKEEWKRVIVDIGEYRGQREEVLRRMAERAAHRVQETGEAQELTPMPAFERRKIHMFVSEVEGVTTKSIDTGRDRRVVVSAS